MPVHPHLQARKRIVILFFLFFLLIIALSIRLFFIQVVYSSEYQKRAFEQRTRELKVEPRRGIIYDRRGRELAISASSETVVAIPLEIESAVDTARKLASVLNMDYNTVYNRITRKASAVYVKRKVSEEEALAVKKLDLPGITFTEESKRFYPRNNLASHILGFAGIDSQGLEGLELSYDNYLKGKPGKIAIERDATGRYIPDGVKQYIAPEDGYNIYLTIDESIQYIAERELDKAMKEFQVSGGTVIIMDPRTGGILALANRPDYDLNNFADYPQKNWRNRAISDGFEPGSTFKIITTAAALEEGVVNENDRFFDPGHIKVSGEILNCWRLGGHGSQTFTEVVQNSCNPGFVQVGMRLGKESFYNYIRAFGFGEKTSIRLPGEASGILANYDAIGPVELATLSFGHGITVTPIQLTTAVAALANKGMLMQPRLVEEIRDHDGNVVEKIEPVQARQVVSKETALRTLKLLEKVVSDGTGTSAAIEGYRIGGKTGTAKHYGAEVYDSSFIGILPVDDPQLVILVVFYDVTGPIYYGSQTAAPVFRNIAIDTLRYLGISPKIDNNKNENTKEIVVPDVKNMEVYEAENILRKNALDVKIIGRKDTIIKQVPLAGAKVLENTTVLIFTEEDNEHKYYTTVPDFKGLKVEEAQNLSSQLGLILSVKGNGRITKQDIQPGERVPGATRINVEAK
ncbi:MAG: stage V sporulation protein D [Halanaerobiaceae bacterium]|nr:stage V sporulation protein D [Halanaerobiaceae bacterium]